MPTEKQIVSRVIRKYGPILDLNERPGDLIDILRRFSLDDGGLPGGVPPSPPGPSSLQDGPSTTEIMKELLKLNREVAKLRTVLGK